jgi:O-methyltransferase
MQREERKDFPARLYRLYERVTLPFTIYFLLASDKIHDDYDMTTWRKMRLGYRMYRNTRHIWTGISYRAHLAMAVKLLELPPNFKGDVVECGCFRGGTTANLSLVCDIVDRHLYVYDSFEGLPDAVEGDQYASPMGARFLAAGLDQVSDHVRRHGAIDRCTFVKGWFADTLPHHDGKIALAFLDVDYQSSLNDCILNLWPHLHDRGFVFIDEYVLSDFCALFYSERFWSENFDRTPPGLFGGGSGVQVGHFWLGPFGESSITGGSKSIAYTRKHFSGHWNFFPDDD